jgi:predicted secreted protein
MVASGIEALNILDGQIDFGVNVFAAVTSGSLSVSHSLGDTTAAGDAWMTKIGGLKSWTATVEGFVTATDDDEAREAVEANLVISTRSASAAVKLRTAAATGSILYTGNAFITAYNMNHISNSEGAITFSATLEGTGALTLGTVPA